MSTRIQRYHDSYTMSKLQVEGYVGEAALAGVPIDDQAKTRILNALRDFVELTAFAYPD